MLAPVAVAAVLALAGCASLGGGSGTAPGGSTNDDADGGSDGSTNDDADGGSDGSGVTGDLPFLQVTHAGGFVPMGYDFRTVPELTLYPDGTAITHGAQTMIYPGPALPPLVRTELTEADVDAVVDAARDAGLLAPAPDYGQLNVTDVPTTTVTLRVDGEEYVHAAYGLGIGDQQDLGAETGLEADAVAARASLTGFLDEVRSLIDSDTGGGDFVRPDRFAIFAQPLPDEAMQVEEGIERQVLPWPVEDVRLADAGGCVTVDGDAGSALGEALAAADQLTVFEDDGVRYEVFPRPLLPHEKGCDDLP